MSRCWADDCGNKHGIHSVPSGNIVLDPALGGWQLNKLRIYGALISALVLLAACAPPVPPAPTPTSTPPFIDATIEYLHWDGWGHWRELSITPNGSANLNDRSQAMSTL